MSIAEAINKASEWDVQANAEIVDEEQWNITRLMCADALAEILNGMKVTKIAVYRVTTVITDIESFQEDMESTDLRKEWKQALGIETKVVTSIDEESELKEGMEDKKADEEFEQRLFPVTPKGGTPEKDESGNSKKKENQKKISKHFLEPLPTRPKIKFSECIPNADLGEWMEHISTFKRDADELRLTNQERLH